MSSYLLIESRDPYDSADCAALHELALGLAREGHRVTMFLVQNGVLPVRTGSKHAAMLERCHAGGVRLLADGFSLRERAIDRIVPQVTSAGMEELLDLALEPGTRTLWH